MCCRRHRRDQEQVVRHLEAGGREPGQHDPGQAEEHVDTSQCKQSSSTSALLHYPAVAAKLCWASAWWEARGQWPVLHIIFRSARQRLCGAAACKSEHATAHARSHLLYMQLRECVLEGWTEAWRPKGVSPHRKLL